MSATIPPSQSMFLFSLLAGEKENIRLGLRGEIDRLMDPMLESIFKRLNAKLVKSEDSSECDGVECGHVDPLDHVESHNPNVHQLVTFNALPAASTSTISSFNTVYDDSNQQLSGQVSNVNVNDTEQMDYDQQEIKEELEDEPTISNQLHNPDISLSNASTTSNQQEIKEELEDEPTISNQVHNLDISLSNASTTSNQQEIKEELEDELTISNQPHNPDISLSNESTISNQQSNLNLINREEGQVYQNDHQQVHAFGQFESHQSSSLHDQTSTFFPHTNQTHSNDYELEVDQEILDEVNREIEEEEREKELRNLQGNSTQTNEQIEDENDRDKVDEDTSDQDGDLVPQSNQMNIVNDNEQMFDELEINEEDGDEDDETQIDEIDELAENNQNVFEVQTQSADNASIESNPPHLSGQSQVITRSRIRKHKRTHDDQQQQSNENVKDNQDDEEIGEEEKEEEYVEDEEHHGSTSGSVKRTRRSQTKRTRTKRSRTEQSLPSPSSDNNQNQFNIINLKCPEGCNKTFPDQKQINVHLKNAHSIERHRCFVKDCHQSFSNQNILSQHIKRSHENTDQWFCDKCDSHYASYKGLLFHNHDHHMPGRFQCSFPGCQFVEECKKKVVKNHYARQHKPKTFICQHSDCNFNTMDLHKFKRHQRTHLGIKPFKCKWQSCDYAAVNQHHTIKHIRFVHIAKNPNLFPTETQPDPKDYLEVLHALL